MNTLNDRVLKGFLGTGVTADVFQTVDIAAVLYDSQETEWRMGESSMAQSLSTLAAMPSGPGVLPDLHLPSSCILLCEEAHEREAASHRQQSEYGCQTISFSLQR